MANPVLTFSPFTAANWASLKSEVQKNFGIDIEAISGQEGKEGVTLGWNYDAAAQSLTLQILDRHFWDPSVQSLDNSISQAAHQIMQAT